MNERTFSKMIIELSKFHMDMTILAYLNSKDKCYLLRTEERKKV